MLCSPIKMITCCFSNWSLTIAVISACNFGHVPNACYAIKLLGKYQNRAIYVAVVVNGSSSEKSSKISKILD